MSSPRIAALGILVFAVTAAVVQAEPADRGARRGHRSPNVVVVAPGPTGPFIATRALRDAPFARVAPGVRFRSPGRYRPVYRPGLSVGIYLGSPYRYRYPYRYAYPYAYSYPYAYPYSYAYPYPYASSYPGSAPVYATPPQYAAYGGVRLQVTPRDAAVYVDGYYSGTVDDFDGSLQQVPLEAGPHHFEIRAPGYQTLIFDVNVRPDETIRYRGDMEPR